MALWCLPEVNAAATAAASLRLPDSIAASVDTAQTPRLNASQRRRERVNEASADTTGQIAGADSTSRHSLSTGPRIVRAKVDLDNPVDFQSTDSIAMQGTNKAYLYGQGKVTYGSIKLDADQIDMDINKSTVYAIGRPDSTGEVIGTPVFDDNGQSYESKTMTYNFDTGRGFITDVIT